MPPLPPAGQTPAPKAPPGAAANPTASGVDVRTNFVKGELSGGAAVHPQTQRSFIGVAAGVSALPSDQGSLLNAFYVSVEPQLDLRLSQTKLKPRFGLGVPLNFELVDTRSMFEECIKVARAAKAMPVTNQLIVEARTAECVSQQKDKITANTGRLRRQDWDEPSDFAKVIRYITLGGEERPFYLNVSRLYGQSLGHGTVVRRYNANLDYDTARVGATFDAYHRFIGFESMVNDIVNPDVFGVLWFVRPFEPFFPKNVLARSLSFGLSVTGGVNLPGAIAYEKGLFEPSVDAPIPAVDPELNMLSDGEESVNVVGLNAEIKVIRTQTADLKLYVEHQRILDHGKGYTLGSLWRFTFGNPPSLALRLRGEVHSFDANFLPSFFDGFHDIHKLQYMPAGYKSTGGLTYYPTKLGFLKASAGGPRRTGAYLEGTLSLLNYLTLGLAFKGSVASGDPADPMAWKGGPAFDDFSECSWVNDNLSCDGVPKIVVKDPGYSSLLLHMEIPFKRFLQAFATYEVFSSPTDGGLGPFKFDGENEIFFSGARLMLLPVLFIQAEARRYYFLQRLSHVDVDTFTIQQDQNFHAEWTFAVNIAAGYEF